MTEAVMKILNMWLNSTKYNYRLVGKFELAVSYGWNDSRVKGLVGEIEYNLMPYTWQSEVAGYKTALLENEVDEKFVLVKIEDEFFLISQK